MALRLTQRKKIVVSAAIHPEYRQVLNTYLSGRHFKIEELNFNKNGLVDSDFLKKSLDNDTACFAFQSPNFFGNIENIKELSSLVKEKGAMLVMVASPLSLALLEEPANQGVDIVCGDGQELGGPLNFGGPSFGFLATKNEFLRQLPGRIVGKTTDKNAATAYCLTLQAREQHIRREKATSNICSNQSLNAIMAAIYLSLMGKEGIEEVALYSLNSAHHLYERLKEIGKIKFPFSPVFFNEFVWQIDDADKIINKLYKKNIIGGAALEKFYPHLENCILSYCSELKTKEEIDSFIEALKEVL
jgi:glycine dehydrogenase subunit 1